MRNTRRVRLSLHGWLLAAIVVTAFAVRLRGIAWPRYHPDEYPIASWIEAGRPGRVYPGGYFMMIRPFRGGWHVAERAVHRLAVFSGASDSPFPPTDYILMGRVFNALLGALTCLFIYLAGRQVSRSEKAALLSAALFAFAQYHVEHSHYAESDIAMLFMLSVALWFWTVFLRTRRTAWWVATALACGFAAGTKFTLAFLFPSFLVFRVASGWRAVPHGRWRRAGKCLAAGGLFFMVGLVAATPDMIRNTGKFLDGMAYERARVYQEGILVMGLSAGDSILRWASRWTNLRAWSRSLGLGWLALWLAAFPCVFLSAFRRFWAPLVLTPLVYVVYWFFFSPWVRTQEFMVFLPFAAIMAPLALLLLWRTKRAGMRGAALLLLAVSLGENTVRGLRVSSVFEWTDTRLLAGRWLRRHEPEVFTFAFEKHAQTPSSGRSIGIDMIARSGIDAVREQGIEYVLRNGAEGRRGMLHPVTGKRFPPYEALYQEFLSESERLVNWSLLPPRDTLTSFNSVHLDLYGLRRFARQPSFDGVLPQPVLISREGRETFFPVGRHLGSATALPVTRRGVTCAVGGPNELRGPVYAILYSKERSADIRLQGFGRRVRVRLGPYDAAVVPLERPWWAPRLRHVERIHVRASPLRHITEIHLYLRIAFTEKEAERILEELGHDPGFAPDRNWGEELDLLLEAPATGFVYRGVSAWYYDQFARLRMPEPEPGSMRVTLRPPEGGEPPRDRFEALLDFPAERASIRYTLRLDFLAYWHRFPDDAVKAIEFLDPSTGTVLGTVEQSWPLSSPGASVSLAVPPGGPGPLRILLRAAEPLTLEVRNSMLEWDIQAALDAEIRRVALVRTAQMLEAGHPDVALAAWRRIPPAPARDIPRRRLKLELLHAHPEARPSDLASAAKDLLEVAPNHYLASTVLAGAGHAEAAARAQRLSAVPEPSVTFGRFVRILGFSWDAPTRTATCTLEVIRDHIPPLTLNLLSRRHGRWRTRAKYRIAEYRLLAAGERFVLEIPVPEDRKFSSHPHALALAVESDVPWVPGRFPAETRADGVVRFSWLTDPDGRR